MYQKVRLLKKQEIKIAASVAKQYGYKIEFQRGDYVRQYLTIRKGWIELIV